MALAEKEIAAHLRTMPRDFTSADFLDSFEVAYPRKYEAIVELYLSKAADRPHAIQTAHAMLMLTVDDRFHHLAAKVETIPNP